MSRNDLNWLSLIIAKHIITERCTIRETAEYFKRPKSTVSDDMKRVRTLNPIIYQMVMDVFESNKAATRFN